MANKGKLKNSIQKKLYQEVNQAAILNMICTTKSEKVNYGRIVFPKHHNVKWKSSKYDLVGYTCFWIHWMEGKINPVNWKHCKIWMKRTGPWGITAMLELVGWGNKNYNITHKNNCTQNNNSKYCSVKMSHELVCFSLW